MKVLAYTKEDEGFTCPKCGEKIKLISERIDDIILSINNLKDTIDGAKLIIETVIKTSTVNIVNIQLKSANLILNTLNEDIDKTKLKVNNLMNNYQIKNKDNNYNLSYMMGISSNSNKTRKSNTNERNIKKNSKTPEIKEEKITFDKLIEDKIIKKTSLFLDEQSRYNFYSCNKKLIKYLQEKLSNELTTLEIANNISEYSTAQDQINSLKLKYSSDQFEIEPPKFSLSRGTVKAIELLNNGEYGKIFDDKELLPPLDGIIFIYRIFFQFWKDNDIKNIQDQKLFWIEASNFILKNSNGKIGDFFRDSVENFEFSGKNIYEAKKLINGKEDQLKPAYFTKICGTTGLVVFLIKDTLEYCGVLLSLKKNVPSICLKYLEYIAEMQSKMKNYIDNISTWRDNA